MARERESTTDFTARMVETLHGLLAEHYEDTDPENLLRDALADLRHMADAHGLDFDAASLMAEIHYNDECDDIALEKEAPA